MYFIKLNEPMKYVLLKTRMLSIHESNLNRPISVQRIASIIMLQSIYGWSAITYMWFFRESIPTSVRYMDLWIGLIATVPLVSSMALSNHWRFEKLKHITSQGILFIFGKDYRPIAVGLSSLVLALVAGIGEELFFRAVIQEEMTILTTEMFGMCMSVLLFGLAHAISVEYMVCSSIAGIYFSWLYLWCGRSIVVVAICHTLYDWIVFMYVHYEVTHY